MDLDTLQSIIFGDENDFAECSECGHSQDVEPDADYPCPECDKGRLVSQCRRAGII